MYRHVITEDLEVQAYKPTKKVVGVKFEAGSSESLPYILMSTHSLTVDSHPA